MDNFRVRGATLIRAKSKHRQRVCCRGVRTISKLHRPLAISNSLIQCAGVFSLFVFAVEATGPWALRHIEFTNQCAGSLPTFFVAKPQLCLPKLVVLPPPTRPDGSRGAKMAAEAGPFVAAAVRTPVPSAGFAIAEGMACRAYRRQGRCAILVPRVSALLCGSTYGHGPTCWTGARDCVDWIVI